MKSETAVSDPNVCTMRTLNIALPVRPRHVISQLVCVLGIEIAVLALQNLSLPLQISVHIRNDISCSDNMIFHAQKT